MNLTEAKKIKHLSRLIAFSFFASAASFIVAALFFQPDFSTDPPHIPDITNSLGQIQTALYILASTVLGVKLAEEKKTIPTIGFTMMAIAQGVLLVVYLISINSNEKLEEAYKMFTASMYLLVPSMLLIAFYSEFPRWLNIAGVVATVPYIIENVLFQYSHKVNTATMNMDGLGQIMINLVAIAWGIIILRNAKREISAIEKKAV